MWKRPQGAEGECGTAAVDKALGYKATEGKGAAVTAFADLRSGQRRREGVVAGGRQCGRDLGMAAEGVASVGAAARTAMGNVAAAEPVGRGKGVERAAAEEVTPEEAVREKRRREAHCCGRSKGTAVEGVASVDMAARTAEDVCCG